jgi:hypothetical protein
MAKIPLPSHISKYSIVQSHWLGPSQGLNISTKCRTGKLREDIAKRPEGIHERHFIVSILQEGDVTA